MKNPKIKTYVRHSEKNTAWNVIGTTIGGKYKVARIPYTCNGSVIDKISRLEAKEHADFISWCFNNSDEILNAIKIL